MLVSLVINIMASTFSCVVLCDIGVVNTHVNRVNRLVGKMLLINQHHRQTNWSGHIIAWRTDFPTLS